MQTRSDVSLSNLPGGEAVAAALGADHDFHDAEIEELRLLRLEPSILRVHTWTIPTDRFSGTSIKILELETRTIVTFTLEDILELKLEGFSPGNVISSLAVRKVTTSVPPFGVQWLGAGPPAWDSYEVALEPCFGLSGVIQARRVSLSFERVPPQRSGHTQEV